MVRGEKREGRGRERERARERERERERERDVNHDYTCNSDNHHCLLQHEHSLEILSILLFLPVLKVVQIIDKLFLFEVAPLCKNYMDR